MRSRYNTSRPVRPDGAARRAASTTAPERTWRSGPQEGVVDGAAGPEPTSAHVAASVELVDALRAVERALRLQQHEAGHGPPRAGRASVSAAERAALRCLADAAEPLTLSALAESLHRDPSSVSVVVSRLVERGLVQKQVCSEDRRRCLLSVTSAGRRVVARTPDGPREALAHALAGWPEARVRTLTQLLPRLAEALEAHGES